MRRPPLIATLVVLLAVATMIGLGVWQLHRRTWKNDLIARYSAAEALTAPLTVTGATLPDTAAYRRVLWDCPQTSADQVVAGRNADGRSGWAHVVLCGHRGVLVPVVLGWSFGVAPITWAGGPLMGMAVPGPKAGVAIPAGAQAIDWHIVADPPLAGLTANARPDPNAIANNHWSYAIQWFAFAATALIIYALALRKR